MMNFFFKWIHYLDVLPSQTLVQMMKWMKNREAESDANLQMGNQKLKIRLIGAGNNLCIVFKKYFTEFLVYFFVNKK